MVLNKTRGSQRLHRLPNNHPYFYTNTPAMKYCLNFYIATNPYNKSHLKDPNHTEMSARYIICANATF